MQAMHNSQTFSVAKSFQRLHLPLDNTKSYNYLMVFLSRAYCNFTITAQQIKLHEHASCSTQPATAATSQKSQNFQNSEYHWKGCLGHPLWLSPELSLFYRISQLGKDDKDADGLTAPPVSAQSPINNRPSLVLKACRCWNIWQCFSGHAINSPECCPITGTQGSWVWLLRPPHGDLSTLLPPVGGSFVAALYLLRDQSRQRTAASHTGICHPETQFVL